MKSADAGDGSRDLSDDELNKLVDEEREAIEKEQNALNEIAGLIKDAPDEVGGALKVVAVWLKSEHVTSTDEGTPEEHKSFLRQIFRIVQTAIHGPAPKTFSERQVSELLQSKLPDLIKDLALVFNDKEASKETKMARVKELLAAVRESVEVALNKSENEETD